ncbi:MAG: response regulator [Anaerolineae bacterium]|nr:response regulator [Anaerolineae bacterium]
MAKERILIVDDSAEIRHVLRSMVLEPAGYRVWEARIGPEGLRLAQEEAFDLIILDEQLPEMTGMQILKSLREQGISTPVIIMTGYSSEEMAVQALRLGVRDYVIKPFEPREIEEAVSRAMEEGRLRAERNQLIAQLEKANRRLQQQVQELNTLYSIGQSVAALLDLEAVLTRLVEAAVFLARAEEGLLLIKEPESDDLVLRAAKNIDQRRARELRVRVQDSLAGQVMQSGEPLLVVSGNPKVATGYLVRSLAYAPIRTAERGIIGILGVTNRELDRPFTAHDIQLLSALADYAAVALENVRLYGEAETERRKLRAVLQETEEAVVILDPNLDILLCNPAAIAALGLAPDIVGKTAAEVIQHPVLKDLLASAVKADRTLHAEVPARNERTYSAQLTPVEGVGYALMMQDISRLKELDRIKSEFVFTVSHDLRTPLTTILGYVDLLEKVGPLNSQQLTFVDRVRGSITHITRLISDLLDLGRIGADYDLEMEPLHLESIISSVVEDFRPQVEQRQQELCWEHCPLPLIRGNPQRLRQAIENLISNAVKYTQAGGQISIEAREGAGHIVVCVADNGIGIPLADQPYIFDRFYRAHTPETDEIVGTGLGLAIVKSVVEKHGGRIWVESTPGEGSTFTFVLHTIE